MVRWIPVCPAQNGRPVSNLSRLRSRTLWFGLVFQNFPKNFFDGDILTRIGNEIEGLIKIDARTEDSKQGRYAQICIQVDLAKALIPRVKIGNHHLAVAYKGFSAICFKCSMAGHHISQCGALHDNPTPLEKDSRFGDSMLIQRKGKKPSLPRRNAPPSGSAPSKAPPPPFLSRQP